MNTANGRTIGHECVVFSLDVDDPALDDPIGVHHAVQLAGRSCLTEVAGGMFRLQTMQHVGGQSLWADGAQRLVPSFGVGSRRRSSA